MIFYFFYFLFNPILYFVIYCLKFFNKKIQIHLNFESQSINKVINSIKKIDRSKKKVLLFHATSAGEFEQIKPILNNIDKNKFFTIQTFSSPTIFNKEANSPLFDIACYHPYDFFWKSYIYFSNIKPDAYIVTRHDIWPIHLFIARILKIKIFYINANLHNNSIWCQWYTKKIAKTVFENIDFCIVPSKPIFRNACKILDENKVFLIGDTRFDQIVNRYKKNKQSNILPENFNQTQNIIFGSYDSFDEKLIIKSLISKYYKGDDSLKESKEGIILVPHEPTEANIGRMISKLKKNKFNVKRLSNVDKYNTNNIIIIDQVGILADLYKYCHLAYIGAGFGRGVHSVIEPAVYNCIISFGPNIEMLNEAKELYENNLAYMIFNNQDLTKFINLDSNDFMHKKIKKNLNSYMKKNKNVSQKMFNKIIELL
tara:strand:- start:72 stop:1352 length:1281 start_codon:yes stop_codon:yes gene_type:complete